MGRGWTQEIWHPSAVQDGGSTERQQWPSLQPLPWSHTTQFLPVWVWHPHPKYLSFQGSPGWVPVSESLWADSLRGHLGFQQSSSSPNGWNPHWFSQPVVIWASFPGTVVLYWGAQHGSKTTYSSGGTSAAEISLQILQPLHVGVGSTMLHLHDLCQS